MSRCFGEGDELFKSPQPVDSDSLPAYFKAQIQKGCSCPDLTNFLEGESIQKGIGNRMAVLRGINLALHLESITSEFKRGKSIYGYPAKKFYTGFPGFDLSVDFHGHRAETPLGPASGPHTQMVQNILLSFLGGCRIIELKTIQILDRLEIPRPCIDIRNIGYNVEWSQEMTLEESYDEYVNAWVLLKIVEEMELLGIPKGSPFYDTIFDISVGYDLKGISSDRVSSWISRMMDASEAIQKILQALPPKYARFKELAINPVITDSLTLSTFHGCPGDEIEAIVEHLISKHKLNVIVKLNPTLLGYDWVSKTLREDLGYTHIELDEKAFTHDLKFDEAVAMMKRLKRFAERYDRGLGAKFTNTLVVKNTEQVFRDEVMYLSGAPLHVLSMNAMHEFRKAFAEEIPVSFSGGIDKGNFVDAVLCDMKPVTTCTDILKKGGYARLYDYLLNLKTEMERAGCQTVEALIKIKAEVSQTESAATAGRINAERIVPALVTNSRYHAKSNAETPKKVGSYLMLFDCLTCYICLPVCPNAANFSISTGKIKQETWNYRFTHGTFIPMPGELFELKKANQIANLADFCNECGNCDTFCPEDGGPFIEKLRFFFNEQDFNSLKDYDGFVFASPTLFKSRIDGVEYALGTESDSGHYRWQAPQVEFLLDSDHQLLTGTATTPLDDEAVIEMKPYYITRTVYDAVMTSEENFATTMLLKGTHTN